MSQQTTLNKSLRKIKIQLDKKSQMQLQRTSKQTESTPTYPMGSDAKIYNEILANQLKEIRNESGKSMRDVALNIDKSHSFVSLTENHGRRMDVGEFIIYCRSQDKNPVTVLNRLIQCGPSL